MSVVAFLDASVLYPATLRSVLMYLAAADVFQPLWSDAVSREWMQALARNRPDLSTAPIARTRALMEAHIDDPLVTGYEELIASLTLPLRDWQLKQSSGKEAFAELRREMDKGLSDVEAGRVRDFDAETVIKEGRKRLAVHNSGSA